MAKTISSTETGTYVLSSASNPLSITSAGTISAGDFVYGVLADASQLWTVTNAGSISAYGTGIYFESGGSVTNSGVISTTRTSRGAAIEIDQAAGTVMNSGRLSGGNDGVVLQGGGSVTNAAPSAYIGGKGNVGVYISGSNGTITDAGTIVGATYAIQFVGSSFDQVTLDPGAVLVGKVAGSGANANNTRLELAAGTAGQIGTVANVFTNFGRVNVDANASWVLGAANTFGAGVTFTDAGTLTNQGSIGSTVTVVSGAGSLVNTGTITGSAGAGVYSNNASAMVTNAGSIVGIRGIDLALGGSVGNTGTISGTSGAGIFIHGGAVGTVTNAGLISGASFGVDITNGGSVANTGTILGAGPTALYFNNGGTVTEAGTIRGGTYAIKFGGSSADRVILDPGAVLSGTVAGSGPAGATNTLELAGTSGQTGTLSTFGTQFTNFGTVAVDSGASWMLTQANTIGSGVTLTDAGTLTNAGGMGSTVTVTSGAGPLTNSGTIAGSNDGVDLQAGGSVFNMGSIAGATAYGVYAKDGLGTIVNDGTITGAMRGIELAAGGSVDNQGQIAASIRSGVFILGGAGTVTNAGSITGAYSGVFLIGDGSVTNSGTASMIAGTGGAGVTVVSGVGTVTNDGGTIESASYGGVSLDDGGMVANLGTASVIEGSSKSSPGVYISGGNGTITDSGTIEGGAEAIRFVGSFVDRVILDPGAVLNGTAAVAGGSGTNTLELAGTSGQVGTLSSFASFTNFGTVAVDPGASWMFTQANTIGAGATITDAGTLSNAGSIGSTVTVAAGAAPLTNSGTISGGNYGVSFAASGSVTNVGTASLIEASGVGVFSGFNGKAVVSNAGTISGGGAGVSLLLGGTVTNVGTASVIAGVGDNGVGIDIGAEDAGTVTNAGTISGVFAGINSNTGSSNIYNIGTASDITATRFGIQVDGGNSGGTITNAGTISGGVSGVYEFNNGNGNVVNNDGTAGLISGTGGAGVLCNSGIGVQGTVTNAGTIIGGQGVELKSGGTVTNVGTASLISGTIGVYVGYGGGTIIDAGTISGSTDAIEFSNSAANQVILDPGAVLIGTVAGSGKSGATNTLELAAGTVGQVGTLSNVFTNFGTVAVDSGASWMFTQANTIGAGATITDAGTLSNAGSLGSTVTVTSGAGPLTNSGTIAGATDGVLLTSGGTVVDSGTISGGTDAIQFVGSSADRVILDPGAVLTGTVAGSGTAGATNALELAGTAGQVGTLSAFDTQFVNFGTVQDDAGATWVFAQGETFGAGTTVTNLGSIASTVSLAAGASLANMGSLATTSGDGVYATGAVAVTNTGALTGKGDGIYLQAGGSVTNTSGVITGRQAYGVDIENAPGVVGNAGSISGLTEGVRLGGGGSVVDTGAITGKIAYGVQIFGGAGTVTDAGAISGGKAAIEFLGNYTDRVILDPGAALNGGVVGGLGSNTLELAAGTGTLANLATFTNFGTIQADTGASWTLGGSEAIAAGSALDVDGSGTVALTGAITGAGSLVQAGSGLTQLAAADSFSGGAIIQAGTLDITAGATAGSGAITFAGTGGTLEIDGTKMPTNIIAGFGQGDTIDLSGVAYDPTGTATLQNGNVLDVHEDGANYDLQLDPTQNYAGDRFVLSDPPAATNITVQPACFASGTLIRTSRGDVAVEELRVGDVAVTASGLGRPIRWIGKRGLDCSAHRDPAMVRPIRIAAGAFGKGTPTRDLLLSPHHAVAVTCMGEVLVPIRLLVNGTTIAQQDEVAEITYWHIELDSHEVILANGLPAESYIDIGNRCEFEGEAPLTLHPEFRSQALAGYCRPLVTGGAVLAAIRAQFAEVAGETPIEIEPEGFQLLVAGERIAPAVDGNQAAFVVPAGATDLRLVSSTFSPHELDAASSDDRRLGLMIQAISIESLFGRNVEVPLDDPALVAGFHPLERGPGGTWRWTDGDALLSASLFKGAVGPCVLRLTGQFAAPGRKRTLEMVAA